MKKLYATVGLFLASLASAQVPQAFSYQTIAFNAAGAPVANGNVSFRISILDNSATGTVLYTETQSKTTNTKGLVNLNIGQGTATAGNFGGINWGTNSKFVKVEMDPAGGSNYTNVGVNQLMSVPYALVADKINLSADGSTFSDDLLESKSSNFAIYNYSDGKTYVYNAKLGAWSPGQTGGGTGTNYVTASNGNFSIYSYNDGKTYVYNAKLGAWSPGQTGGGTGTNYVTASNGNFCIYSYNDGKTYVYNAKLGAWSPGQTGGGTGTNYVTASNGNFCIYSYNDGKTYVYNAKLGAWSPGQTGGGTGTNYVVASNGNFSIYSYNDGKTYIYSSKLGTWSAGQTGGGTGTNYVITSDSN